MSDTTVPLAWNDLVSLAHSTLDGGDNLSDALARDIARYRAGVTTASTDIVGNAAVLDAFLTTGETDAYVHTIADGLWSHSEVAQLDTRDGLTYRMFVAYLDGRHLRGQVGAVDEWSTLVSPTD